MNFSLMLKILLKIDKTLNNIWWLDQYCHCAEKEKIGGEVEESLLIFKYWGFLN